jgi:N-acetylmuramoyl-L-alanine amidase CwlA
MVHSTGVAQPNAGVFLKNWNKSGVEACVHAFVTTDQIYQALPWNWRGWHAGGAANNTHISFEICEPAGHTYSGGTMIGYDAEKNADYFAAVYKNAVELTAMLCKTYRLDPLEDGVVICHCEGYKRGIATNHSDVLQWFPKHNKNMDTFREDVAALMEGKGTSYTETEKTDEEDNDEMVRYQKKDDIPESSNFRAIVNDLMTAGIIGGDGSDQKGNDDVIDLSHDMVRMLIFEYRAGVYDAALEAVGIDPKKNK